MNVCLVGIDHRAAPVPVLEKMSIRTARLNDALVLLRSRVSHGVILSTCNRTEVYTTPGDRSDGERAGLDFLKQYVDGAGETVLERACVLHGEAAVERLFRTASGLESMVVGEYEILGQVRQALEIAAKAGMVNMRLRHLFQDAIRTGRKVREETGISRNALSVSSVAVELAGKVLGRLDNCRMLVIGAGEAGRLVAKAASDRGVSEIVIASRTRERASELTQVLGGVPVGMDDLAEELNACNIVVTCADAPHYLLDVSRVESAMLARPDLPLVIIDIAVPRNVEPAVAQVRNVFLYNIDDLSQVSGQNREQRELEIEKAEKIIAAEMARFAAWWRDYRVRPAVRALMSRAEEIRRSHLERTLKKLPPLSKEERYHLEMMTRAIVTKILKDPISNLKANGHSSSDYVEMVMELFALGEEKANEPQNRAGFPGQQTGPGPG